MPTPKRNTKPARKTFTPAVWQWDPMTLTQAQGPDGSPRPTTVQWWSAGGSCSVISLDEARTLVAKRAAFCGGVSHVCQVHDGIRGVNAS